MIRTSIYKNKVCQKHSKRFLMKKQIVRAYLYSDTELAEDRV
jgi:hypothetical protein